MSTRRLSTKQTLSGKHNNGTVFFVKREEKPGVIQKTSLLHFIFVKINTSPPAPVCYHFEPHFFLLRMSKINILPQVGSNLIRCRIVPKRLSTAGLEPPAGVRNKINHSLIFNKILYMEGEGWSLSALRAKHGIIRFSFAEHYFKPISPCL